MLRSTLFSIAFATPASLTFAASPLADAPSAFLRAHAASPVHWMAWGDAAFDRAQSENKPVFLFIGSVTSELSRAMREQTFAREEIATLLNENFVCVLVDREQQPAVAALYQTYVRASHQLRGWPLNIWLTPELKPFDGATYLPPSEEWGKEGFPTVAERVLSTWKTNPAGTREQANAVVTTLLALEPTAPKSAMDRDAMQKLLARGAEEWMARFDAEHGGFGDLPKHPEPELLRFLLRADDASRAAALTTLRTIDASALHDPLDGGFFRYASDAAWQLPNFQKTLLDQARLALAFLDAAQITKDPRLAEPARRALTYALSLGQPGEGFIAGEDGTPENILHSFFWTGDEIDEVLDAEDAAAFRRAFGVTPEGNLDPDAYLGVDTAGRNLLHRVTEPGDAESEARLLRTATKLRERRQDRPAPLRADHASSGEHGWLLAALARAGKELPEPHFTTAAAELFAFIRDQLCFSAGGLRRVAGQPVGGTPRDYALVIDGLLTYAATAGNDEARALAAKLQAKLQETFWDQSLGRYYASAASSARGIFARVHVPAPEPSDLPGAEPAALMAFAAHAPSDDAISAALATAIATAVSESYEPARGDQLLALQAFVRSDD